MNNVRLPLQTILKLYYLIPLDHILNHTIPILVSDNISLMFYTMAEIDDFVFYLECPVYVILSIYKYYLYLNYLYALVKKIIFFFQITWKVGDT